MTSDNDWISVVDDWGNKLSMEVTNTWEDGSHSRLPLFVERSDNNTPQVLTDDYYQLAVKVRTLGYGMAQLNLMFGGISMKSV